MKINLRSFYRLSVLCILLLSGKCLGQVVIASDGFNNTTSFSIIGGSYFSGNSGTGDRPASTPFFSEGIASYGLSNGSAIFTSSSINLSTYTNNSLTFRLASFSIGSTGNGADGGDIVKVEVSPDNGTTYYPTIQVSGNSNANWSYNTGIGVASALYDGDLNPVVFAPTGGGSRTTDGYSTVTVSSLPSAADLKIKISLINDSPNELWMIDDFKITGFTSVIKPEASASPSNFICGATTNSSIPLTWIDATGTTPPDGYLIKWSNTSYAAISDPVDGTAETNGVNTQNVIQGTQNFTATGLAASTPYYFKIFSYTNSGSAINYKITGPPQTTCTTTAPPCNFLEDFSSSNATASYSTGTFTGNAAISWTYTEARDENSDANNSGISGKALMLRDAASSSKVVSSTISSGIGNFSVKLYKGFTGSGPRQVELFINNVSIAKSVVFDDFLAHTFSVNNINLPGNFMVELRNVTSNQIIVDDISWTCFTGTAEPNINIQGNGTSIVNGDSTPSTTDDTDFGSSIISGTDVEKTFTIQNNGAAALTLNSPSIVLLDGTKGFTISAQPALSSMSGFSSQTFKIKFNNTIDGTYTETVKIGSNDPDTPVYSFDVKAVVTPPVVTVSATSLPNMAYNFGQGPSANQSFTVGGSKLAGDITITAPVNGYFEIARANNFAGADLTPWQSITLTKTAGNTVASNTIYVRLKSGLAVGSYSGNITVNTPGLANQNIAVTGTVNAGAVDMIVEGDVGTFPNIADGSTVPSGTNNTSFGTVVIGGSITKSFRIRNLGGAALNIGAITFTGANAGDFTVSSAPTQSVINQGDLINFSVTFNPGATGTRTAVVQIANNDPDNNPYDFAIQGTGNCPTVSATVLPSSGPANTVVNFSIPLPSSIDLTNATAALNSFSLTVIPIDSKNIAVIIPSGAASGNIIVSTVSGCSVSASFTVLNRVITGCDSPTASSVPTDLFMSEVTDSNSGGLTYIELYNGTGSSKNLSNYSIEVYSNGAATPNPPLNLPNINLATGSVYVIAIGLGSGGCPNDGAPAATQSFMGGINFDPNKNDYIRLNNGGTPIDSFGVYQNNNWSNNAFGVKGVDLRRKIASPAQLPNSTFSLSDWTVIDFPDNGTCADNDYSDIGVFTMSSPVPPTISLQPTFIPTCSAVTLNATAVEGVIGGQSLSYRWYFAAPTDPNWTLLNDSGIYSGTTTAQLTISSATGLNNYQYYVQVRENTATCYTASNAVQIKDPETHWTGSVWTNGLPTLTSKVVLDGNWDTASSANGNLSVCSLELSSGKKLTIRNNSYVYVVNAVKNNSLSDNFVIESDGNLVQENDNALNSGNITAKRNITLSSGRQQYNYLISPLENYLMKDIYKDASGNPVTVPYVLYHNEANNHFYNSSGAYIKGRALAVKEPSSSYATSVMSAFFAGKPTNGIFPYLLINSNSADANRGYNLIGNPYPSNIDLIKFYENNAASGNLSPTFYFWDNNANTKTSQEGDIYGGQAYAQFNAASPTGIGTPLMATGDAGTSISKLPTRYVKVGQGFMAKVINTSSLNISFSNNIRSANDATGYFGKSITDSGNQVNRFWISMINPSNIASHMAVVYFQSGKDAFSKEDSRSMGGSDNVYSLVDGEKVSINGKGSFTVSDTVPLGTEHFLVGNYQIRLDGAEGIFAHGQDVYLNDHQTGILTNLREGNYAFDANAGESNGRFEIIYQPQTVLATGDRVNEKLLVYRDGGKFIVKSPSKKISKLELFDLGGRLLYMSQPDRTKAIFDAAFLVPGVYVLKINIDGIISVKKIRK